MTKQEIKDQVSKSHFDISNMDYQALSNGVKVGNIKQRELESVWGKVSDQYAEQQAIEFAKWIADFGFTHGKIDGEWRWFYHNGEQAAETSSQLYAIFIKQQPA